MVSNVARAPAPSGATAGAGSREGPSAVDCVASGTASLELAYYRVPMVVLYRVGWLVSFLKRFCLITPHVALVNIVAGERIMPEHVGARDCSAAAADRLLEWIEDGEQMRASREALERVRSRLLFSTVSARAAEWVLRG